MSSEPLSYLRTDPLLHADMLELLSRPDTQVLYASDDACLLQNDWLAEASAVRAADAEMLVTLASDAGAEVCVAHQIHFQKPLAALGYNVNKLCFQCAYVKKEPVAYTLPADTEIRLLDESYAPFVAAHYAMNPEVEHARERIRAGMLGAFVGGELAGFISTHEEGSMGMLEVLPAYRRRRLGFALEAALINHLLRMGKTPFGQVFEDNDASLRLQEKLGMAFAGGRIFWAIR